MSSIKKLISTILLILASTSSYALDLNEESLDHLPSGNFDFLVYAITWKPTFCLLKPLTEGCHHHSNHAQKTGQHPSSCIETSDYDTLGLCSHSTNFSTHGIWPYYKSNAQKTNRHPSYCIESPGCDTPQDICKIKSSTLIEFQANKSFLHLVTERPEKLMAHEWQKHGTCYGKNQKDYFSDFIKFRNIVQINHSFNNYIGQAVSIEQLKSVFPKNTAFRCANNNGKQYFFEVFFLIKQNGEPYEEEKNLQIGEECNSQEIWVLSH